MKAIHIRVTGTVQGVCFRASTREKATQWGIHGWVRNATDGSVEIHAEGSEEALQKLIESCHRGPPGARVTSVKHYDVAGDSLEGFEIYSF